MKEAWPGEFRAAHDPAIEPLVAWLRDLLLNHKSVSANDVPRDLIVKNGWRKADGDLLQNCAIGTALRRLEFDGLAYPAERIPAAGENESHRRVTVYRLRQTGGLDGDMEVPAGKRLVGAAILLRAKLPRLSGESPRPENVTEAEVGAYQAGWHEAFRALERTLAWGELVGALKQMGSEP